MQVWLLLLHMQPNHLAQQENSQRVSADKWELI